MIADDHCAASRYLSWIPIEAYLEVENCSQEKRKAIVQPTDDLPSVGQFEQTDPQMHERKEAKKEHPDRNNRQKLKPPHDSSSMVSE